MKEIKLKVDMDFSEASVEQALMDFHNESQKRPFAGVEIIVSVFDVSGAVDMLIDSKQFDAISKVSITPNFRYGEWEIVDHVNELRIHSES